MGSKRKGGGGVDVYTVCSLGVCQGRPRLKKAIANAYSPFFGKKIDSETEVTITTGANEGMLSAFMAFVEPGDEVIVFEPFFDQYAFHPLPIPCIFFGNSSLVL